MINDLIFSYCGRETGCIIAYQLSTVSIMLLAAWGVMCVGIWVVNSIYKKHTDSGQKDSIPAAIEQNICDECTGDTSCNDVSSECEKLREEIRRVVDNDQVTLHMESIVNKDNTVDRGAADAPNEDTINEADNSGSGSNCELNRDKCCACECPDECPCPQRDESDGCACDCTNMCTVYWKNRDDATDSIYRDMTELGSDDDSSSESSPSLDIHRDSQQ
jgi:hypothetical protein